MIFCIISGVLLCLGWSANARAPAWQSRHSPLLNGVQSFMSAQRRAEHEQAGQHQRRANQYVKTKASGRVRMRVEQLNYQARADKHAGESQAPFN
jgi:hypothetical protein